MEQIRSPVTLANTSARRVLSIQRRSDKETRAIRKKPNSTMLELSTIRRKSNTRFLAPATMHRKLAAICRTNR